MADFQLGQRVTLGTDGASFLFYHPDDFPGRPGRPMECLSYDFAWNKEVGKVVAFCTGGDGGFSFRLTSGGLTRREQRWRRCSAEFLLTVRHGELLLDNGCGYDSFSFDIPNGHYRVTLHGINWSEEPGATEMPAVEQLPSYVVCFEPVADPSVVKPIPWPPRMDSEPEPTPACSISSEEGNEEPDEVAFEEEYILLVEKDVLVLPGADVSVEIPDSFYASNLKGHKHDYFIIAPSDQVPTVAVIAEVGGGGKTGDNPWHFSFRGKCLVTVTKTRREGKDVLAQYDFLERPQSRPSVGAVADLKAAFLHYARSNPRGLHIDNLEFILEKWEASPSAERYAWWLLATLPLRQEERNRLAVVSLADQVRALHAWLTSPERTRDYKTTRTAGQQERDLLRAIIEDPEDDGKRLIYADWLDEQGDPRGEFIRVECELEILEKNSPRHKKLTKLRWELLEEHGKDWKKLFEKLGIECRFRRGLISSAEMSAKQFLQYGEALMDQAPVTRLVLKPFDRRTRLDQFKHLAGCTLLSRLSQLQLSSNEINDEELAVLVNSPYLKNLHTLLLIGNSVGPKGMKSLAASPHLANLTSLVLTGNTVQAIGAAALAGSKTLRHLHNLGLCQTCISDAGIEALSASSVVDQVTSLSVSWRHTSDVSIDTAITERGVAALARSPHFSKLESLDLGGNPIGDAGVIALANSPALKNLKTLDLADCGVTHVGAQALASSKSLASLVELRLGGTENEIDDRAAAALAKSPRLERLNLFMNLRLTEAGKKLLRKRFGKQSGYDD
jgi:uncharacterized protein (TIGR02996 family)